MHLFCYLSLEIANCYGFDDMTFMFRIQKNKIHDVDTLIHWPEAVEFWWIDECKKYVFSGAKNQE